MNRTQTHPDDDAIALLARAMMPIFAAVLAHAANDAVEAAAMDDRDLTRAA